MDYQVFKDSAKVGLERARVCLSVFTGKDLSLDDFDMSFVDIKTVPLLAGDPESIVLSSYAAFCGDLEGQLMMLFRPDTAERLATFLAPGVFQGIRDDEIPKILDSLILEVANVVGSSLLNAVADGSNLKIVPSPPILVRDMAGAILSSALAYCGENDTIYVVHIKYSLAEGRATFEIVLLPKVSSHLDMFVGDGAGQCRASLL